MQGTGNKPAKLLIVAGEAAGEDAEVPAVARLLIDAADEILVVVPALPTRFAWLASDTDKVREAADERLRTVLSHVGGEDKSVAGEVGADDPLLAFEDAVAGFEADHILIALRGSGRSGWQESGLVGKVLERFGLPVTAFRLAASG